MCETQELYKERPTFEDFKNENGLVYWWASDMMQMLGYTEMKAFQKVIDRATKALISLNINCYDNIIAMSRDIGGIATNDFKLTRFACYLVAMNGDPKKVEVANAQAYFVHQARQFELYIENSNEIERLSIWEDFTDGYKSLSATAKQAEVSDYAMFMNAGYLGMYNMGAGQLASKRGVQPKKIMDYMGKAELAANTFRITMTEEKIKSQNIKGQQQLEQAHHDVGMDVRNMVAKSTGRTPENLPQITPLQLETMLKSYGMKKSEFCGLFGHTKSWFHTVFSCTFVCSLM